MGDTIRLPVLSRDAAYVAASVARVEAFWPGVSATIADGAVALASERFGSEDLERLWTCALLNERLVVENAEHRSRVLADLVA